MMELVQWVLRVLEVLASGLILPGGPGLQDPCERDEVDVFGHLSPQQREDLTRVAQTEVRHIHYRKIHITLGMEDRASKLGNQDKQNTEDKQTMEDKQDKQEKDDRVLSQQLQPLA